MRERKSPFIDVTIPKLFGYVCACCPAPDLVKSTGSPYNLENDDLKFSNEKPRLLMISYSEVKCS